MCWGTYSTTVTRPDLFENYLTQQIGLLIENHNVAVTIGPSDTPMPVHFAVANYPDIMVPQEGAGQFILRDVFDVPDLGTTNDDIINGIAATVPVASLNGLVHRGGVDVVYLNETVELPPEPTPVTFTTFAPPWRSRSTGGRAAPPSPASRSAPRS